MRSLKYFGIVLGCCLLASCAVGDAVDSITTIPSAKNIHLAACMKVCNTTAKKCLDESEIRLNECVARDEQCNRDEGRASKLCVVNCLDCINVCIAEVEKELKK